MEWETTMPLFKNKYRIESTRLRGWDYTRNGYYFVTICTKNGEHCLGTVCDQQVQLSPIGEIVAEEWQKTPQIRPNVRLDAWVIMPNHLHGILIIDNGALVETARRAVSTTLPSNSLGSIIGQVKAQCTKRIHQAGFPTFA
jgi:putative transposase